MAIQSFKQAGLPNTDTKFFGAANFSNTATGTYTGYKYVTFTGNGTLTVTTEGLADILIIGGGGAAGYVRANAHMPGGGGAGGFVEISQFLAVGAYTVTVGGGGANASNGQPSEIAGVVAGGGGYGGEGYIDASSLTQGKPGASGGGGGDYGGTLGGAAILGSQGYAGANGIGLRAPAAGGGAGGAASGATPGPGRISSITGSAVTYARGGSGSAGTANATVNTGNGGDSIYTGGQAYYGWAGGSGIVIVRVAV